MSMLSIIIVNYNGRHFLDDCLASIAACVTCPHEVIVVDNASSDGSVEHLRTHHPGVRLIESPTNTGFTGGNNLGVRQARGDLILLLNNDTVVQTDFAPALAGFANPKTGVVGARLFYGDGRQQASVGYEHTPLRLVLSWLGLKRVGWLPNWFRRTEESVIFYDASHEGLAWVSGACLFTRKALWDRLGGLDERYFMYLEDVDYCRQVREAGYQVCYTPAVRVTHYEGAGRAWLGARALSNSMSSYVLFTRKHYGRVWAVAMRWALSGVMYARGLAYGVQRFWAPSEVLEEKLCGYLKAARLLRKGAP